MAGLAKLPGNVIKGEELEFDNAMTRSLGLLEEEKRRPEMGSEESEERDSFTSAGTALAALSSLSHSEIIALYETLGPPTRKQVRGKHFAGTLLPGKLPGFSEAAGRVAHRLFSKGRGRWVGMKFGSQEQEVGGGANAFEDGEDGRKFDVRWNSTEEEVVLDYSAHHRGWNSGTREYVKVLYCGEQEKEKEAEKERERETPTKKRKKREKEKEKEKGGKQECSEAERRQDDVVLLCLGTMTASGGRWNPIPFALTSTSKARKSVVQLK